MAYPAALGGKRFDASYLADAKMKRPPSVFKTPKELTTDPIQLAIKEYNLHEFPEHFPTILEDLRLSKFWGELCSDEFFHVFQDLAINRVLNFYEASVCGGLDLQETRIGVVAAIMTATINLSHKSKAMGTVDTPVPSFMGMNDSNLDTFEHLDMASENIKITTQVINAFSRTLPTSKRIASDKVVRYLMESMKFWVIPGKADLKSFMLSRSRYDWLPSQHSRSGRYLGTVYLFDPSLRLLESHNTIWGRVKAMKYNVPAIIRNL